MIKFQVTEDVANLRLDKALVQMHPERSRAYWQTKISEGAVTVNGDVQPCKFLVKVGDVILITEAKPVSKSIDKREYDLKIPIVFENSDCLVINKPSGIVSHPAHAQTKVTIAEWAANYRSEIKTAIYDSSNPISVARAGIVHRLDKNTSGVMIIAKNAEAMNFLAKQIQSRNVTKTYVTLLFGHLERSPITVHNWLGRSVSDRRQMAEVGAGEGREAETIFTIKHLLTSDKGDKSSLVLARPITGRTHQIRVHAKLLGHPVLGDDVYGSLESQVLSKRIGLARQWLHAESLTIVLPNQSEATTFVAPLPDDLEKALKQFVVSSE